MKFFTSALLALAAIPTALVTAADPPNGQVSLGIARDVASTSKVANAAAGVTYTSKIEFDDDVMNILTGATQDDKDAQLAGLARNAYWEMTQQSDFPGGSKSQWSQKRPYVMTALAVGKVLYLSSSMRGGHFIYAGKDKNNPLYQGLVQCQTAFIQAKQLDPASEQAQKSIHKNNAACGEAMTMYAYYQDENKAGRTGDLSTAVAVTVRNPNSKQQQDLPWDQIEVFDPCGTDQLGITDADQLKYFGCAQMTRNKGVRPITAPAFQDVKLPDRRQQTQVHLDCAPFQGVAETAN